MPEGDTIYRTAQVMRRTLGRDEIVAARGKPGAASLARVVGSRVRAVRTRGKHLLIDFDRGLTLHTHMHMQGAWHRYRPGERWREAPDQAVAVLETASAVAVCFGAPTVELIETRALPLHPVLGRLGPDLLDPEPDVEEMLRRLRAPVIADLTVAEALLDQRIAAGIGNVYRCETLFLERVDPFAGAADVEDAVARRLFERAARLLRANLDGRARDTLAGPADVVRREGRAWVHRRAGRPCRRCGTIIRSTSMGRTPRRLYWCPRCQQG